MKNIIIILFCLLIIAIGLWYFDETNAQKIDILGEIYYTEDNPNSLDYGQDMVIYAVQGDTVLDKEIIDSNTEKIATDTYKIYAGLPQFMNQTGYWSEIDYQRMYKTEYDSLYKEITPISFIQSALAQTFSTAVDGVVMKNNGSSWSDLRGGAGNNNNETNAEDWLVYYNGVGTNMYRSIIGFDTTSLDGTVSSASLYFKRNSVAVTDGGNQTVKLGLARTGITNTLENTDYAISNFTLTEQSDTALDITNLSANSFYGFPLNTTGKGNINLTSNTNFSILLSGDWGNTDPGAEVGFQIFNSEQTGTDDDPYLKVVVTAGGDTGGTSISYASSSFSDVDMASEIIKTSLWFFAGGFVFSVWYFGKRNKKIF